MITTTVQNNNFINYLHDPRKTPNNVLGLITNYIALKDGSNEIDIDRAYKNFCMHTPLCEREAEILENVSYNDRKIIAKKLQITDDIYLLISREDMIFSFWRDWKKDVTIPEMIEKITNKLVNKNFEFKRVQEILAIYKNDRSIPANCPFFSKWDYYIHYYYPEEYQPLAKFIYDIQKIPIKELQVIFPEIENKVHLPLRSVKLNYLDYLHNNYDLSIDKDGYLSLETKIDINLAKDLQKIIDKMALPIMKFKTDLIIKSSEIKINDENDMNHNLIKKCSILLTELRNLINQYYSSKIKYLNPIQKWNAIIKKITLDIKECNQPSPIELKPKFDENDDFYLLFKRRGLHGSDEFRSFEFTTNLEEIEELIANNEQLRFIDKSEGDGKIIRNWDCLYKYEPEMYQQLAKHCYNILNDKQKIQVNFIEEHIDDDDIERFSMGEPYSYETLVLRHWQVTKISYKDYITGSYKLIVNYKYPFSIAKFLTYEYEIVSNKQGLILENEFEKEIENLQKAINYLEKFLLIEFKELKRNNKKFIISKEYIDAFKANILKPLFISINTEASLLTIKDFCLSVDLLLGNNYQVARTNFREYLACDLTQDTEHSLFLETMFSMVQV